MLGFSVKKSSPSPPPPHLCLNLQVSTDYQEAEKNNAGEDQILLKQNKQSKKMKVNEVDFPSKRFMKAIQMRSLFVPLAGQQSKASVESDGEKSFFFKADKQKKNLHVKPRPLTTSQPSHLRKKKKA